MRSAVLKGFDKMQKRLHSLDFLQVPAGPFLREWREDFKNEAIRLAPVWKHGIQDSIKNAQDTKKFPLWARVFSDNPVSRWANFGTGMLSVDPESSHKRYFPSVEGVTEWSEDHGLEPYSVALGIYHRGGTPPTLFFSKAAESANSKMGERMQKFRGGMERQAGVGR